MCEYPRDSPLHWLECSGDNLTPKEKTTLKRAQLDLVALNLECTRTPIQVHEEASSLDPAKKRRYLFLTGRCADLSYGQATAAQTSMARIRRIRTKYREQYNEMFPPVEPTRPPGKSILQQKETRNALLQDWQNSSPSSKEEKWKKMVTDHSRSTIDRWMRKGITENVITETYGMVKRQVEPQLQTRIREIYTETSHAKRWKLVRQLLDKKYAAKKESKHWSRNQVDRTVKKMKDKTGAPLCSLFVLTGCPNNRTPEIAKTRPGTTTTLKFKGPNTRKKK